MTRNRPAAPLFATINVTGMCNLRCKYCFFQPRLEQHMAWTDFKNLVDQLKAAELFFLNLSGGEVFTHPDIDRFLQYAHEKFDHVVVLTNGTLLRPRNLETISKIVNAKGSFPIQVSLDSISTAVNLQTRSRSDKILENIRKLSDLGANIVVAMVITRFNAPSLIDSIRTLSRYVRHFHLMEVQTVPALNGDDEDFGLGKSELDRLWRRIEAVRRELDLYIDIPCDEADGEIGSACGAPCVAAFSQIVVDPDLRIRPCDRCVETFVGDLTHQSLRQVWEGEPINRVLDSPIPFCRREDRRMDCPRPLGRQSGIKDSDRRIGAR